MPVLHRWKALAGKKEFIRSSGMTQMEAAQRLGVGQSRVSSCVWGEE
ncbi:sigma-70 family RNA polymerase sigma factor [Geotalea uraniireducens]|nr:hypothetical protein [Geotalea uraniireducens]